MVSLSTIHTSNAQIASSLPSGLVAVFIGATNGVGETTVRQFAKCARAPRVYIVGRSKEAGERIVGECEALNPDGTFVFIACDASLMRNVDVVCKELGEREEVVNLLFLTVGTLQVGMTTEEGLHYGMALTVYARSRFITNLLPLIQRAKHLRRVVSVYGAGFEGQIAMDDFQGHKLSRPAEMAHQASITTLELEAYHKTAREVTFIHAFPGAVESGIARGSIGPLMRVLKTIWAILGPLVHIPLEESGDRHVFLCTSARFSNGSEDEASGVPLVEGLGAARGINGEVGSGVYSIDEKGESASSKVERLLTGFKEQGLVEEVHQNIATDIEKALASNKGD